MVLAASAHVIVSGWRISTDHQEVSTSPNALMSGAGGQNDYITGLEAQCAPALPTKLDLASATGYPQHLVDAGVVVDIVVDSVPPGISPAVVFEQIFEHGGGVETSRKAHHAPVDNQGPSWMVRDNTVIPEAKGVSLPLPNQAGKLIAGWPRPAGDLLYNPGRLFPHGTRAVPLAQFSATIVS